MSQSEDNGSSQSARKGRNKAVKPASGKVLVAAPFLNDFYFGRSVIILADHNKDGSFGIVLNKPLDLRFNEIIEEFDDFNAGVFIGGPVKPDSLFFIHTLGETIGQSIKIIDGLYWGGDIDVVRDMIRAGRIEPAQIRFFLGYSGWGTKQLDAELKENSWVVTSAKAEDILASPPEDLWKNMVKKLGKHYSEWVNYPIDPRLN